MRLKYTGLPTDRPKGQLGLLLFFTLTYSLFPYATLGKRLSRIPNPAMTSNDHKSRGTTIHSVQEEPKSGMSSDMRYPGSGSASDPYVVEWGLQDPENPYNWSRKKKALITTQAALSTFTVSFCSSSYSGGLNFMTKDLDISYELAVAGVSLYVLGFALGPLVFAPLGEMFGRRNVFLVTMSLHTPCHLAGSLGNNIGVILVFRFLSGTFGSSPITNSGGIISDIWNARERGLASAVYSTAPFFGPIVGPIVGGFVSEDPRLGWHFNFWIMFILGCACLLFGFLATPETYSPVLLRRRAAKLQKLSNGTLQYSTSYDIRKRGQSFRQIIKTNLGRPFSFFVHEPLVAFSAIYISIVYGTLYALFAAFPIVFQDGRGWSAGVGGLAFLGVGVGMVLGTASNTVQNRFYWRAMDMSENGRAPPEARLYICMFGSLVCPVGLFWFAWTCMPSSIHWIIPVIGGAPFGMGVAQVMQGVVAYLMDTYGIYFASAVSATVLLRSIFAAVFPLMSPSMFGRLGDSWAMSIFAFLSLACMPLPFLFFKYGRFIRSKSKHAYRGDVPIDEIRSQTAIGTNPSGYDEYESPRVVNESKDT